MNHRDSWLKILLIILLLAAVGAAGFWIGSTTAGSRFQAERDLNVLLNRSDLEWVGEIDGTVYVTGHKSPDSDTVGSSIAYAALLRQLGYDARPVVLGEVNSETRYILEAAGMEVPAQLEDASGQFMILVDHSENVQSVDGLKDATILGIIDHHGTGTVTTGNPLVYDARPLGATATIIWIRYRNYGLEPDRQTAMVMMGSVLSDTINLQSYTTTSADREALKALSRIAGVSDTDAFFLEMKKAMTSYADKTDEEVFFSDCKEYEAGELRYSIGVIDVYDEDQARDMAGRMKELLPSVRSSTGVDMAFAQVSIFHDDISITYLVPSDDTAAEVIKRAFGAGTEFDGVSYILRPGASRKQVIVPAFTDVLRAYPFE